MWRLLRAELSVRLLSYLAWCVGVVALLGGMLLITEPRVPVLNWGVTILAAVPLLINFTAGIQDAQQHRLWRQVQLPLSLRQVGLARLLPPVLLQILGGGLAVGCAISGRVLDRSTGHWMLAIWLSAIFLLISQTIVAQRELQAQQGRWSMQGYAPPLIATGLCLALLALTLLPAWGLIHLDVIPSSAALWQQQSPYLLALLTTDGLLFFVNLTLFQRRDPALD